MLTERKLLYLLIMKRSNCDRISKQQAENGGKDSSLRTERSMIGLWSIVGLKDCGGVSHGCKKAEADGGHWNNEEMIVVGYEVWTLQNKYHFCVGYVSNTNTCRHLSVYVRHTEVISDMKTLKTFVTEPYMLSKRKYISYVETVSVFKKP